MFINCEIKNIYIDLSCSLSLKWRVKKTRCHYFFRGSHRSGESVWSVSRRSICQRGSSAHAIPAGKLPWTQRVPKT